MSLREAYGGLTEGLRNHTERLRIAYGGRQIISEWTERYPEIEKFERHRGLKRLAMYGGVVVSAWSLYTGRPARGSALLVFLTLAALIQFDAMGLFSRLVSSKGRTLLALCCLTWAASVCVNSQRSIASAGGFTALSLLAILTCNKKWTAAEVYKRNPTVRKALAKCYPEDIEALWQMTAGRMVRTLCWELGAEIEQADNEIWYRCLKGAWLIGYSMSKKISADTIAQLRELQEENEELKADAERVDDEIREVYSYFQDRERYDMEMEALRAELTQTQNDARAARVCQWQQANEIERLRAELAGQSEPTEEPANTTPVPVIKSTEELLAEAVELGYGVPRAARHAGTTHYRAQLFYESHREEVRAAKARIKELKEA